MGNPDNKNIQYDLYLPIWQKCSAATDGQEAIKGGTTKYLPKLPAQKSDPNNGDTFYSEYLEGAVWYEATGRTVDVLRGLPFRKPPQVIVPEAMNAYIDDITADEKSCEELAKKLVKECIVKYRAGVLVDYPNISTAGMSVAEVEALNIKPYATFYNAESILDWRESIVNNKLQTSFISLQEFSHVPNPEDEFDYIEQNRIRVLDLQDGIYRVRIYQEIKQTAQESEWELVENFNPVINGSVLNYIPFFCVTADGESWELDPPMINGLANLNIAHYKVGASYQNGLLMAGNPTACFVGLDVEKSTDRNGKIRMGSNSALHLNEGGNAFFLQVGTEGFAEINNALGRFENQMSVVGARILAEEKKAAETAETTGIKFAGENSILADLVNSVSAVMTKVLNLIAEWSNIDNADILYKINTDFLAEKIDATMLVNMFALVQGGLMSEETFFYNLKRGELIPDGVTFEQEKEKIKEYLNSKTETLDSGDSV